MDPAVPLVVSQVNPDDLGRHEGIIANPNCSTMQLVPVAHGPARRRRPRAGRRRHLPVRLGHRRRGDRRARGADPGPRRRRAEDRARSTRTRSPSTPCPRSTSSSRTATRRRSGRSSPRAARSSTCPELRVSCTAVRVPVFVSHSEAVHVETTRADHAGRGARRCSPRCPASSSRTTRPATSTRSPPTAAGRDEIFVGRVRQDPSIAGGRGLAFWVVSDNLRKGAATNAVEIAEVLVERDWVRAGRAGRARSGPRRDAGRAP